MVRSLLLVVLVTVAILVLMFSFSTDLPEENVARSNEQVVPDIGTTDFELPETSASSITPSPERGLHLNHDSLNQPLVQDTVQGEAIVPAQSPEAVLLDMFMRNGRQFAEQLESYYLQNNEVDEWSKEARTSLSTWFEFEGHDVVVDCTSDICLMDVIAPYETILAEYRPKLDEWKKSTHTGFLDSYVMFNNNGGSYRVYFYRESFDPNLL